MADSNTNEFDERVCHVSYHLEDNSSFKVPPSLFKIKQLKSFLFPLQSNDLCYVNLSILFQLNDIFTSRIESLRALRMCGLGINKLPSSLGKLIHLRYLDFSYNCIRKLSGSITQLVNLYLLDLSYCQSLEELPENIDKLVMLRHLNLIGCYKLSHMPKALRSLTGLETLGLFVVGKPTNDLTLFGSKAKLACDLSDLGCLNNLKGELTIVLVDRSEDIVAEAKAANLDRKDQITQFTMIFRESNIEDEMVLENLKPSANLKYLNIKKYGGRRFPSWMREGIHLWLPNLVYVKISDCKECINMCSFGRLPHLKYLYLKRLDKVEYIEENGSNNKSNMVVLANEYSSTPLFPSLTELILKDIPELKGWWSNTESSQDHQTQNQLLKLMPAFPKLKSVFMDAELVNSLAQAFLQYISSSDYSLTVYGKTKDVKHRQPAILLKNYLPMLRSLKLQYKEMKHIPEEFRGMSSLTSLSIYSCEALEALPNWIDSHTSLKDIYISECPRLKSLPHEISNLSNLNLLWLDKCSRELAERCQSPSGEDWPKIQHIPNITITIKPAKNEEQ